MRACFLAFPTFPAHQRQVGTLVGKTNPHAARLRRQATDAERVLWSRLRSRQLGGLKFRRQATIGSYVVDFLCAEIGLVVEADGGQHSDELDAGRTAFAEGRGLQVVRFWNTDILRNIEGVLTVILSHAEERKALTQPSPAGGRGLEKTPLPPAGKGGARGAAVEDEGSCL